MFDWSNEQYLQYLEQNKEQIISELLTQFKTKRSNLYINTNVWSNPLTKISEQYVKKILFDSSGASHLIAHKYVEDQFKELVSRGKILAGECKSGICFRTAKDAETELIQTYLEYCSEESEAISYENAQKYIQKMYEENSYLHAKAISAIVNYAEWVEKNAQDISDSYDVQAVYDEDMQCYRAEHDNEILGKCQYEDIQMG